MGRRLSKATEYMDHLEHYVEVVGRTVSWLALVMVSVQFFVVVMRYAFDLGWISVQESVTYMHAVVFMLAMAYTLRFDGHVRVDIFYRKMGRRQRAFVDLLGTLLLLFPVCVFIIVSGWDYVAESWRQMEGSREAGGIPAVWVLKSLIIAMPVLLLVEGVVWVGRSLICLISSAACEDMDASAQGKKDGGI